MSALSAASAHGTCPDISFVIPVYGNAGTVADLYHRLAATCAASVLSYEVIFVDDASPDESMRVLGRLAVDFAPQVSVVPLARNGGQHRAVLAGLARVRGSRVVVMDADLQDPPEAVPRLLRGLDQGYAAVFAGRRGRYESIGRLLTSRVFKTLLHWLCRVPADAGMFVAMDHRVVEVLLDAREPHPFVVSLIGASGLPLTSIPVERAAREGGGSAYSSRKRLATALRALGTAAAWRWRGRDPGFAAAPAGDAREAHNRRQRAYYESVSKRNMLPSGSPYLRRHVEELLCFAEVAPGERVLEVGCGMGRYTLLLAERGVAVEGLDLSPVLLDRLRSFSRGVAEVPLHCADIADPPVSLLGGFDVVAGLFVLHHLRDLEEAFRSLGRLLRPGGRLVFLEPNALNPLFYVQMAVKPGMTWKGDRGIVNMRRGVVLPALERAGLGRARLARFGFFPPFLANRRWGRRLESWLERVPVWRSLLPFLLVRAERV
ncbi:MAG TPA: glycosyltransferase [Vicinamibacteria bacterium]|nr:glycosyltransferase [Vicinamibacteria bacterium]